MKKLIIGLLIVSTSYVYAIEYNYLKPAHEQYQDIIINNVVVSPGVRECANRYEALHTFLKNYNRPFTMLDIGASQGYFSFRAAHDFPDSSCVMIEGGYSAEWQIAQQLQDLCQLNTDLKNITFLQKKISVDELIQLGHCEHFDVTLLFNIAHHFGPLWKDLLDAIFALGDHVIIETPTAQENSICGPIEKYIKDKGGILICQTPRHTNPQLKGNMYLIQGSKKQICKSYWNQANLQNNWHINSNFDHKTLIKKLEEPTTLINWLPGINLMTFKMLHGTFPTTQMIKTNMLSLNYQKHMDPFLWNLIINGQKLTFIDCKDQTLIERFDPEKCMLFNQQLLHIENAQDLTDFLKEQPHWKFCINSAT